MACHSRMRMATMAAWPSPTLVLARVGPSGGEESRRTRWLLQVGLQLEVMLDVRVGRREHPFVVVGVALVAGLGSIRRRRGDAATAGPSFEVGTAA